MRSSTVGEHWPLTIVNTCRVTSSRTARLSSIRRIRSFHHSISFLVGVFVRDDWVIQWLEAEGVQIHRCYEFSTTFNGSTDKFRDLSGGLVEQVVSTPSSAHVVDVVLDLGLLPLICTRVPSMASVLVETLVPTTKFSADMRVAASILVRSHVLGSGAPWGWTWIRHLGWGRVFSIKTQQRKTKEIILPPYG